MTTSDPVCHPPTSAPAPNGPAAGIPAAASGDAAGTAHGHGLMRQFLAERDTPCPGCGYNLRGLTGSACPECNQALQLSVGLVEPRLGAFVAGVVGLGMSLGFCAVMLAWVGTIMLVSPRRGPPMQDLIPMMIGLGFSLAALTAWVLGRRRWLGRMSPIARWAWAAGASVAGMGCPAWFIAIVD